MPQDRALLQRARGLRDPATDVETIYQVPLSYHAQGFDTQVMRYFGIPEAPAPDLSAWETIVKRTLSPEGEVAIAVVGKYTGLRDAYKSLFEALTHGGVANRVRVDTHWIEADDLEANGTASALEAVHGVLVPGGFGERGVPGKIAAVKYARTRGVPYFGICSGCSSQSSRPRATSQTSQAPAPPSSALATIR